MTDQIGKDFRVDVCKICLEAFGGHFYDTKPRFFRACFFCKKIEECQNFIVKIADEDPPNDIKDKP